MAKYPFPVKHNGVLYEPGKEVPVGVEAKKEDAIADKSAKEIREELKALGVTKFPSNKKEDLAKQLEEALKAAEVEEEDPETEEDDEEVTEPELEDEESDNEGDEETEPTDPIEEDPEGEEGTILDQIINE